MPLKNLQQSTPLAGLTELPPLGMDAHSLIEDFRRYYT